MSAETTEIERIKKLVMEDLLVDAVELPQNHHKKAIIADDIEEILHRFDDDAAYAHFIIRVKRAKGGARFAAFENASIPDPKLSLNSMVNETIEISEQLTNKREARVQREAKIDTATHSAQEKHDPAFLLQNAQVLENSGEYTLARNIYQSLVRKGIQIAECLSSIACTFEKEGNPSEAILHYQEAIAYSSEIRFYQSLSAVQIKAGRNKDATETLMRALGLSTITNELRFEFHKSLGNCFTRLDQSMKAEHHYMKAFELNPKSDVLQVNVGSLALQKKDYLSALKHFQKALDLNSKNDRAITGIAMAHLAKKNVQKAHEHFAAALSLNIHNLSALFQLVRCAQDLKQFDTAIEMLQKYLLSNPVQANVLYSYAAILLQTGKKAEALEVVQRILSIQPQHDQAKELLKILKKD